MIETGLGAWWTSSHLRIVFFRPIASLTHMLDHAPCPSSPALMHLHSIAWYAALVAIVIALYRRTLGRNGAEPWVVGLATLLFLRARPLPRPAGPMGREPQRALRRAA